MRIELKVDIYRLRASDWSCKFRQGIFGSTSNSQHQLDVSKHPEPRHFAPGCIQSWKKAQVEAAFDLPQRRVTCPITVDIIKWRKMRRTRGELNRPLLRKREVIKQSWHRVKKSTRPDRCLYFIRSYSRVTRTHEEKKKCSQWRLNSAERPYLKIWTSRRVNMKVFKCIQLAKQNACCLTTLRIFQSTGEMGFKDECWMITRSGF